jgi:hypothetical protein
MNPNTSVKSVDAIPRQAITPRISRNGLIGRCSATSGLGIEAVIDSKLSRKRKPIQGVAASEVSPSFDGLPKPSFLDSLLPRFKTEA